MRPCLETARAFVRAIDREILHQRALRAGLAARWEV